MVDGGSPSPALAAHVERLRWSARGVGRREARRWWAGRRKRRERTRVCLGGYELFASCSSRSIAAFRSGRSVSTGAHMGHHRVRPGLRAVVAVTRRCSSPRDAATLRPEQLSKAGDSLDESVVTERVEDVTHGAGRTLERGCLLADRGADEARSEVDLVHTNSSGCCASMAYGVSLSAGKSSRLAVTMTWAPAGSLRPIHAGHRRRVGRDLR